MSDNKILLEYVWIDAYFNLRSKIKILTFQKYINFDITNVPEWNYDGSSTGQATGHDSDIIIKPVRLFKNPFHKDMRSYLVLCHTFNNKNEVLETNNRNRCVEVFEKYKEKEFLFGIEQEYIIVSNNKLGNAEVPFGWKTWMEFNSDSYCSAGGDRCYGRQISDEHLIKCLEAGISICGSNAEVMTSQWEYQIGAVDALEVSDHLWMSRYILNRITEKYDCYVSFHPKPFKDYAGSGLHTNVSTNEMRNNGGIEKIMDACEKLRLNHEEHLKVYGLDNFKRLTGNNETCSYKEFKYGKSDRGSSIRIPLNVYNEKCGYLEDRRPGANADPYLIVSILMETISN